MTSSRSHTSAKRTVLVGSVPVEVERRDVKNITIRVRRDKTVHASVPRRLSEQDVDAFLQSRRDWIERYAAGSGAVSEEPPASVRVWGIEVPVVIEEGVSRSAKASFCDDRVVVRTPSSPSRDAVVTALRALFADEVRRALPAVVSACEARVGAKASAWRIRHMTSRWGSCNVKTRAITINSALAQFDRSCLEQVVTHELCHIFERGHNARFYALMDKALPSWRDAHALLKEGQIL